MPKNETEQLLAVAFAQLSQAAARRKIYSRKAAMDGSSEIALFLKAMSASEAIQARRLFNSLIGKIDISDNYKSAIFEKEVPDILEVYSELHRYAGDQKPALLIAIAQLQSAEKRLRSFYSEKDKDIKVKHDASYHVCKFCGYLSDAGPPEKCPVCGASKTSFKSIL
jgi:rubrerythrin